MRHISQLSIPVPAQGRQCGNSDGLSTGSSSGHGAKHCAAAPSLALLPLTPRHSAQHSVCFHGSLSFTAECHQISSPNSRKGRSFLLAVPIFLENSLKFEKQAKAIFASALYCS